MIESIGFLGLVSLYVYFNRHEPFEINVACAIAVAAIYLAAYILIPPKLEVTSMRLGAIFGYVPLVSFGVILFPQLNSHLPVKATRLLGWFGLVATLLILCILKLFVW